MTLKVGKFVSMLLNELLFVIRYIPDQYKTQQMCDKVILEMVKYSICFCLLQKSRNMW